MDRMKRRAVGLLLAFAMLLSLAACGKDKDDTQQLSATVYVPQFMDLNLDILGKDYSLSSGCTDGTNVYLLASIYPDWEAGEEGDTRYAIIRVPLDGGEAAELENFEASEPPEGYDQASAYLQEIRMGADGSLWVEESVYAAKYDLPEDFDSETDYFWNYEQLESVFLEYQVQLDSTGNEITRIETSGLAEKAGVEWLYSGGTVVDKDGDLFVCGDGKIVVLDSSLNLRFTVEDDSLWGGSLVQLSDGTVGAVVDVMDTINQTYSRQLRSVDKAAKDWGESYDLPQYVYETYSGGGDYLFYYKNGETLYGYRAEVEEGAEHGERILSWLDADINSDEIDFFSFLPDGRVVVMISSWYSSRETSLAILSAVDRSEIPEKTILTYAAMNLGQDERNRIIEFNKNSATHRIEVTDYGEYATSDDYFAGITKLNAEILAGKVPDIISVGYNVPLRQYGANGFLEDLWPFIENDPDIGRESLMERVLIAAEQDGKLYQVFNSFSISTIAGSNKVVGEDMGWTMAEFQEALASMPEGCTAFGEGYTKSDMLATLLRRNLDSFVDWETGECFFDSDSFKTALAFCDTFPLEFDYENYDYGSAENSDFARIASGRQMLYQTTIYNFEAIQMCEAMFGGEEALNRFYMKYDYSPDGTSVTVSDTPLVDQWGGNGETVCLRPGRYITFKGYPMEDGSCGSSFEISGGLAMSSTCQDKEAAWSFIRQLLLPEDETDTYSHYWNFPVNKADFEKMAQDAMEVTYEVDSEGNTVLDPEGNPVQETNSTWGTTGLTITVQATSQEEYDQIMELYNAVTNVSSYDSSISEIVTDVAGSYFAGDRSLDDAADLIQNRVNVYVNENR